MSHKCLNMEMNDIDDVVNLIIRNGSSTPEFIDAKSNFRKNPEIVALNSMSRNAKLGGGGVAFLGVLFMNLSQGFGAFLFVAGALGAFLVHKFYTKKIDDLNWKLYIAGLRAKYEDIKANMSRAEWESYKLNLNTTLNSGKK